MSAAAANLSEEAALEAPSLRTPYWTIVWRQLRQNGLAVFGLAAIAAFFELAIFAPLISHDQPFVWMDDQGLSFPWLRSLFNRLIFQNAVDVYFNLAMVLSPLALVVYLVARRRLGERIVVGRSRIIALILLVHAALFLLVAPKHWGPVENPLYFTERVQNYTEAGLRERASFAVFPPNPHSFSATNPSRSVVGPSLANWLGTDKEGRDVFARMLYGTRVSITIGVVAVSIYVGIGILLGALAGYYGGWIDIAVSRAIEVMICFPSFFLILTLAAFVQDRSIFHVMVIIGITSWPGVARLIRAEFLKHKQLEYVQAARALGMPRSRIIFRHILPNAIAPALVTATFGVASAVLTESSLAFLGLGDVTVPSWGGTLASGRVEQKLWLILVPGAAIFALVSVFNLVGEGLRDALDPKLRS